MQEEYLTIPEAAIYAGVSVATIYNWIRANKLPIHRTVKASYVRKTDLDRLLAPGGSL